LFSFSFCSLSKNFLFYNIFLIFILGCSSCSFSNILYVSSFDPSSIISIVLKPENIEHLNELTRFTSYIGAKTIEEYGIKAQFKFPNDILINGKKIAGILAESVFIGNEFKGVITGVGINLNLDEKEIKNIDIPATSVYLETGKNIEKSEFLEKFLYNFKKEYESFLENGMNEEARELLKV